MPPVAANYLMGIFSAIIDNVPLTAALLKSGIEMSPGEWMGLIFATYMRYLGHLLLAYTLGYAVAFMLGRFIH